MICGAHPHRGADRGMRIAIFLVALGLGQAAFAQERVCGAVVDFLPMEDAQALSGDDLVDAQCNQTEEVIVRFLNDEMMRPLNENAGTDVIAPSEILLGTIRGDYYAQNPLETMMALQGALMNIHAANEMIGDENRIRTYRLVAVDRMIDLMHEMALPEYQQMISDILPMVTEEDVLRAKCAVVYDNFELAFDTILSLKAVEECVAYNRFDP